MRSFAKTSPQVWFEEMKEIADYGGNVIDIAIMFYLTTCPAADRIGIYPISIESIGRAIIAPSKGLMEGLRRVQEHGLISYDNRYEYVWIKKMGFQQLGENLSATDNNVKHINAIYEKLPPLCFLKEFYDTYSEAFHIKNTRGFEAPSKGLAYPLRSTRDRRHGDLILENVRTEDSFSKEKLVEQARPISVKNLDLINQIFDFWQTTMGKSKCVLDDKRSRAISKAIKNYTLEEIKSAILGCAKSEWHMGSNEQGTVYDDIELILRNSKQIEMFMGKDKFVSSGLSKAQKKSNDFWAEINSIELED